MNDQPRSITLEPPQTVFDWKCLQPSEVALVAKAMKTHGYAVLDNLVSDEDIRHACEVANRLVGENGNESVFRADLATSLSRYGPVLSNGSSAPRGGQVSPTDMGLRARWHGS